MRSRPILSAFLLTSALVMGAGSASAATTITEYELPAKDEGPVEVAAGPDGNIWTTLSGSGNAVVKTSPLGVSTVVLGFTKPPAGIAVGADGNLWVTEPGANLIARVTPVGVIEEFSLAEIEGSKPTGIAAGPDGNLWFTEEGGAGAIARINPKTGKLKEYSVGLTPNLKPHAITVGGDGALWFTETGGAEASAESPPPEQSASTQRGSRHRASHLTSHRTQRNALVHRERRPRPHRPHHLRRRNSRVHLWADSEKQAHVDHGAWIARILHRGVQPRSGRDHHSRRRDHGGRHADKRTASPRASHADPTATSGSPRAAATASSR